MSARKGSRLPIATRSGSLRVDLLVDGQIVVEIKSAEQLVRVHHRQVMNYMRVAGVRAGVLVNFNVAILLDGLSRKVL